MTLGASRFWTCPGSPLSMSAIQTGIILGFQLLGVSDGYQFLLLVPALFNTSRAGGWNAKANRYFGSGFQQGSRHWEVVWGGDSLKHAKGLRCCKSIQVVQWFHHTVWKPKKSRNWVEMTAAAWKSWDSGLGSRSLQQGLQPGSTAENGSQNSQQQAREAMWVMWLCPKVEILDLSWFVWISGASPFLGHEQVTSLFWAPKPVQRVGIVRQQLPTISYGSLFGRLFMFVLCLVPAEEMT